MPGQTSSTKKKLSLCCLLRESIKFLWNVFQKSLFEVDFKLQLNFQLKPVNHSVQNPKKKSKNQAHNLMFFPIRSIFHNFFWVLQALWATIFFIGMLKKILRIKPYCFSPLSEGLRHCKWQTIKLNFALYEWICKCKSKIHPKKTLK